VHLHATPNKPIFFLHLKHLDLSYCTPLAYPLYFSTCSYYFLTGSFFGGVLGFPCIFLTLIYNERIAS